MQCFSFADHLERTCYKTAKILTLIRENQCESDSCLLGSVVIVPELEVPFCNNNKKCLNLKLFPLISRTCTHTNTHTKDVIQLIEKGCNVLCSFVSSVGVSSSILSAREYFLLMFFCQQEGNKTELLSFALLLFAQKWSTIDQWPCKKVHLWLFRKVFLITEQCESVEICLE